MKPTMFALFALAACGHDHPATTDAAATGDAATDATVGDFTPGCTSMPQLGSNPFASAAEFGAFTPGTLAGWDPNGRWFLTGTKMGSISSFFFETRAGGQIIVDRDDTSPGTFDNDAIFQRQHVSSGGTNYLIAIRVADRRADGTARADRAVCDGGTCRVCTAKLERATHNNNEGEGDHLALVGQLSDPNWGPGYTFNVRVDGTLAYLIRQDGLHIIETADPAHPVELGHYKRTGDGYSNDVKLVDAGNRRYAIIADFPVDVVDVTNPAAPTLAGQISEEAHTVAVETRNNKVYAYFGNYDARCPVYDVTDPAHPMKVGAYTTSGSLVHDLSVLNGVAFLNAWDAGFLVVDFTNPASPQLLGTWGPTPTKTSHSNWTTFAGGNRIALHGEEAYGAHLSIVDLNPASSGYMKPFAEWKTRDWVSIHNIMAFGTKAYFTYYQDGVRVLDVSNPQAPVQLGYYNTWDPQADYTTSDFFEGAVGIDVDLARHLIFVADSPRGLLILTDSTP